MNDYRQLSELVENYVQILFKRHHHPELLYHNISHTSQVVSAATQIANHYELGDRDVFIVIAAAWFHDVGYLKEANGHEAISAGKAIDFLTSLQVDHSIIEAVSSCILATTMPQHPNSLCEQILCDADLYNLGTDFFWDDNTALHKEYKALYQDISEEEWQAKTLKMMQTHQYFTHYCQQQLTTGKGENIMRLSHQHNGA